MTDRRLLLVHAHPDDESSSTGATMAKYVAEGAAVTLVTCTLGEVGDVVLPELIHLRHDHDDALAPVRLQELTLAMEALGVTDFVRLGGDGRWSDSGMVMAENGLAGPGEDLRPNAFWTADLLEAGTAMAALIRDRQPQVLITYDTVGGYGHPDHVQAHRVATYGAALAAVPSFRPELGQPWQVDRVLWGAFPATLVREMIAGARAAAEQDPNAEDFFAGVDLDSDEDPPMSTPDRFIAVTVDGYPYRKQRYAALRAHATQVPADGFFFMGEDGPPGPFFNEYFTYAAGVPVPEGATDVFAGLAG